MMGAIKIFFFGDSVCFGQGVSIHRGWVTRISAALADLGQQYGREITIINVSHSGNTTRQALERMPYDVQSHQPDAVIAQFGMNDCNYWESDKGNPRVSPKAFAANMEEIITRAFTFGAKRVFLHTNHPTLRDQKLMHHTTLTYQESNRQYNQIIRDVARSQPTSVILNDIEQAFDTHTGLDRAKLAPLLLPQPDLLHLSEEGHNVYYASVYPAIEKALTEMMQG